MVKYILIATMGVSSLVQADWIDDLAVQALGKKLNQEKAVQIMEDYVKKDRQAIRDLDQKIAGNSKGGAVACIRDGSYKIQRKALQLSLRHHKKVVRFINSLARNENDRIRFTQQLYNIRTTQEELATLKEASERTGTIIETAENTASRAQKELYIQGIKASIHTSFFLK